MYYKTAVVDDERSSAEWIASLVVSWAENSGNSTAPDLFSSAEAFLFRFAEDKTYDLLLLDIELGAGRIDGVALAKQLRAAGCTAQIIFITGYTDYIAEGYEVAALHYLIKPVDRDKLFEVLNRAATKIARKGKPFIAEANGETLLIPLDGIRYFEVYHNYVTIHAGERVTVKKSLSEIERSLDPLFFRIGRSYIVNLAFIRRVTKVEAELSDGSRIPVPRGSYDALCRAMIARL